MGSSGVAGEVQFNPTVKVVWEWPGDPEEVPEYLTFLVEGDVQASANSDRHDNERIDVPDGYKTVRWGEEDVWQGTVNGSIGGLSVQGEPVEQEDGNLKSLSVKGNKLFRIKTNGRTRIDDVQITLSAEAKIKGGRYRIEKMWNGSPITYGMYGYADASGNVTAKPDNRSVRLSRPGAIDEKYTLDNGVPTTEGDTTYSYNAPVVWVGGVNKGEMMPENNWQSIQASLSGDWKSHVQYEDVHTYGTSYTWSPAGTHWFYKDHSTGTTQLMPMGQLFKNKDGRWEGTSSEGSPHHSFDHLQNYRR